MMGRCLGVALAAGGLAMPLEVRAQQVPSVSCEVADFSMTMRLYLPLGSDGSGSPGGDGMQGTLEIHHQKVPKDQRLWSLEGKRPAQFWNRDGELKLMLLLGPVTDRITVVIEAAQRQGYLEHLGSFRLVTGDVSLTGRLACNVG